MGGTPVDARLKTSLWQQFGAAIDTLDDTIQLCPDRLWSAALWDDAEDACYGHFWFVAYHAVFWLDLFLTGSSEGFTPPAPFVRGRLPDTPYTKADVLAYLKACRQKAKDAIESLTDEQAYKVCVFEWMAPMYLELQLYSMRHVQEHAAELSLVLGQNGVTGQDWVPKARD
ncbi:MAG: DinB family protein [Anaerolineae bacterium]|nr:DinB family protein [Anaerolineae bacterium]